MGVTQLVWSAVPRSARPLLKRLICSRAYPPHWLPAFRLFRILLFEYGYLRSVVQNAPVAANGLPLPWYTYPAIEYLTQLDFSDAAVFEFGSGHSTLFWAQRATSVVSVEESPEWYEKMRGRVPANCTLLLETQLDTYADTILQQQTTFDVIVIDGGDRYKCAQRVASKLRPGGLVILDNSDWAPESSLVLRQAGLLEVDMTGFVPALAFTSSTSLYFDRMFNRRTLDGRQPHYGTGAKHLDWEVTLTAARRARGAAAGTTGGRQ
jgi:hypothetical protein